MLVDALLAVGAMAAWVVVLARLGVFTRRDVAAWRRLASLRGYARPSSRVTTFASRSRVLRSLREELDIRRLLAVAGRPENESAFLMRMAFLALAGFAAAVALDTATSIGAGAFALPLATALLAPLLVSLACVARLRAAAQRRREVAGRTLGDMMMLVAIVTDGRGMQVEDAVRILARCATTNHLQTLVDGDWRRLVEARPRTTAELYTAIAQEYRIEQFAAVAEALVTTNVGVPERDTYARVAQAVYQRRLADARTRAARARILVTLPVAGMLVPLLVLLGAPTLQSIAAGLGSG